ncbi:MAG: proton-conducting transporter membrane subunit [bacterium]|nr:proton-conducting transporter membrane subunit [bacterium]
MIVLLLPALLSILPLLIRKRNADYALLITNAFVNLAITAYLVFSNDGGSRFIAVDALNKPFLLVLSAVFFASSIYSVEYLKKSDAESIWHSLYASCFMLFDLLMILSLTSQHIGLYWVLLEATTILTAPLIYFSRSKHSLEAAWKYVFICSIGIAIGFLGIIFLSITFKHTESLFFSDFYGYTKPVDMLFLKISFLFIIVGFGTKMGLAPLHFWLPDAHSEAPSPVSAMLSAALLNTALTGILRVLRVMYVFNAERFANAMLVLMGLLSVFVSAVFILRIKNYKRMLAYSSVENMGIIALSIGTGGLGIFAGIIHMAGHSLLKSSLFLSAGNILEKYRTKHYDETGNIASEMKFTGYVFLVSLLGLLGMPTSLTFLSEFLLVKNMIERGMTVQLFILLLLLTALFFGFVKMTVTMLFSPNTREKSKENALSYFPQILLMVLCFALGLMMPDFVRNIFKASAEWIGGK